MTGKQCRISADVIWLENQWWIMKCRLFPQAIQHVAGSFFMMNLKIKLNLFSRFLDHYTCRQEIFREIPRTHSTLWTLFVFICDKRSKPNFPFFDHINTHNLSLDCLLIQYGSNIVDFCIHLPGVLTSPVKNISNPLLSGSNISSEWNVNTR